MRAECENVFITIYMTLHHLAQHSAHPLACVILCHKTKLTMLKKEIFDTGHYVTVHPERTRPRSRALWFQTI